MAVSDSDKKRMQRLTAAFREAETDAPPDPRTLRAAIAAADRWRAEHGIPPLADDDDTDPPERELYRRARALGLRRRRG